MSDITIKIADFINNNIEIKNIRTEVFILEQNVPIELEWDEFDNDSTHFLAYYNNNPVATARLLKNGYIGRMAVLKEYRSRNIGKIMLKYILKIADKKAFKSIKLSAQEHAIGFYKKHGFSVTSDVYIDAGIPHYDMEFLINKAIK